MKIDVEKIVGYNEMSPEEKIQALMNFEFEEKPKVDNNDEVAKLKNALNKASSDVAEFKRQLREKQSESERAEAERAEREAERETLLKTLMREKDISNYQAKFLENGYDPDLAKSSATAMADNDFNTIFANLKAFNDAKEKEIRANVLKGTPSPVGGNPDKAEVTKEQFNNMGYNERAKLYAEKPELYQELSKTE